MALAAASGTWAVGGIEVREAWGAIAKSAAALLLFNLLDGLFTLTFLQMNVATEANPVMRAAYEGSPLWFMLSKLAMVNAGLWILATHSKFALARVAVHASAVLYAGIVAYHLTFLVRYVA